MPIISEVTRISLKNILFPTDFSQFSKAALPFASTLARTYGATILMSHVIPAEPHLAVPLDRLPEQDDAAALDARQKLTELMQDPTVRGVQCKLEVRQGELSEVIPELIHDREVDFVVLGTHGHHGLSKLVLGSGAEQIYRTASCPVLTIGPKAQGAAEWNLRRVLCPVDLAEDPAPVLQYALSLAEENQSEIIILEAMPLVPWQHRPLVEERRLRVLRDLIPPQAENWCKPQLMVRWEYPADAILEVAREREADLIVMSVHKARVSALSSHLPWPVASEVVSRAHCPVLTLRI
jgi:nucleotide-binding universal stress UspA family protein